MHTNNSYNICVYLLQQIVENYFLNSKNPDSPMEYAYPPLTGIPSTALGSSDYDRLHNHSCVFVDQVRGTTGSSGTRALILESLLDESSK